jgi:hypothetical protein
LGHMTRDPDLRALCKTMMLETQAVNEARRNIKCRCCRISSAGVAWKSTLWLASYRNWAG